MWKENDKEALSVAILHTRRCGPTEAEGARKAVRFLTVPSFPTSPGNHLCDDSHPKQGACADQARQGHLSWPDQHPLVGGKCNLPVAELWGKG